jgi:hypothetical protein
MSEAESCAFDRDDGMEQDIQYTRDQAKERLRALTEQVEDFKPSQHAVDDMERMKRKTMTSGVNRATASSSNSWRI